MVRPILLRPLAGLLGLTGCLAVQCPEGLEALTAPNCEPDSRECPLEPPYHSVHTTVDGVFRYVETTYCPPYDWSCLKNAQGRRPCARRKTFKIPLYPTVAEDKIQSGLGWPKGGLKAASTAEMPPTELPSVPLASGSPMLGAIGVFLNGVALNGVATKLSEALPAGESLQGADRWVDAAIAESWMNDACLGHLSGGGNYHTHAGSPPDREACDLPADRPGTHSPLLGWAFDGYGIYGPQDEGGEKVLPSDLDACGGHHQEKQGGYHYHLVDSYPYALECYHGCPEPSNNFRFEGKLCIPKMAEFEPLQPPPVSKHLEL